MLALVYATAKLFFCKSFRLFGGTGTLLLFLLGLTFIGPLERSELDKIIIKGIFCLKHLQICVLRLLHIIDLRQPIKFILLRLLQMLFG